MKDVDTADLIEGYRAGLSTLELAEEFPLSSSAIYGRLARAGVKMRPPGGQRRDLPVEEITERYRAGESVNALSAAYDVARSAINKRLREAGVYVRGQSEAEELKWSQMTEEERKAQVAAANEAARGRTVSLETKCKAAKTREEQCLGTSPIEGEFAKLLRARGIDPVPQKAIGPYNCDLGALPVAVEIWGGNWHFGGRHAARAPRRFRHILDAGWHALVIYSRDGSTPSADAADHVVSFREFGERHPAAVRQYRVIRGSGEFVTSVRADADEDAFVAATRNPLNV